MCVCIHTTDMPFIHRCFYLSPIEEFVTWYYSFSLSDNIVDKTQVSKVSIFHENYCVYICGFIYTHMANTYTHTIFSANASWI